MWSFTSVVFLKCDFTVYIVSKPKHFHWINAWSKRFVVLQSTAVLSMFVALPVPGGSIFLEPPNLGRHLPPLLHEDTISRRSVAAVAASLSTISVPKIQNSKETWGFLLSRGLFTTCKVIRILLWHQCISVYWQKQRPPPQLIDAPQSSPGNSHSDVMSRFLPVRQGQQWEGGRGLHHIIFPQRGRPAAYSCLMAPSCHMASQAAATQERQMLWLHKDL